MALFSSLQLGITSKWLPVVVARTRRLSLGRSRMVRNDPREAREILVIRLDNLGDVVMSTPIFRELKRQCPRAKITVVVRERCREILETNPFIDEIVTVATASDAPAYRLRSVFSTYWQCLRGRRFDAVLHPRVGIDVLRESLLVALVNAPISIGYLCLDKSSHGFDRSQVLTHALPPPGAKNEVLANAEVVEAFTAVAFSPKTEVFPTREDFDFAEDAIKAFPHGTKVVSIGFGAAGKERRWPPHLWAETLELLAQRNRIGFLVFSSLEDAADAELIRSNVASQTMVQLVVGAPFLRIAACIERSDLFLGADSGLAHIAGAMQTPLAIVCCHPKNGDPARINSPARFAPFAKLVGVVSPATALPPCMSGCDMHEPHCICQLTRQEVAEAAEEMLERARQAAALRSLGAERSMTALLHRPARAATQA